MPWQNGAVEPRWMKSGATCRQRTQTADWLPPPLPPPVALPPSAFDEPSPQGFLGTAYHDTLSYFSSDWPVAYLIATVIFGVALLVGSIVPVSQPEQVAKQSILPSTGTDRRLVGRGAGGEGGDNVAHSRPTVGRITGMVDCRWEEKRGTVPFVEAPEGPFRQRGTVPFFPLSPWATNSPWLPV